MKLPWDKEYLKVSFHVIFTLIVTYLIYLILKNINVTFINIGEFLKDTLKTFSPLVIAIIFSYLVNPAVGFFQKIADKWHVKKRRTNDKFKKRFEGTVALYLIIIIAIALGIRIAVIKIGSANITEIANSINKSIQSFSDTLVLFQVKLAEIDILSSLDGLIPQWAEWINMITNWVKNSVFTIASSLSAAGGWIVNVFIGLIISFYLLIEKDRIIYYAKNVIRLFLPKKASERLLSVLSDVNNIFSGYIGGQVTDAIIMAILISVSFSIVGIDYAVIIGLISGFSNLIPYIGAVVAFILSVSVGLLSGEPIMALYAAMIVLVLQQIDSVFIVPKVVGKSVDLHPVLVLLALSVFGTLFGIVGMIFAVPITAIIKLFLVRLYYKKEAEYR